MKIRNGFVSNSSSSSFCIDLGNITGRQLYMIQNHFKQCENYGMHCDVQDRWSIDVDYNVVKGYTSQDNFDMDELFRLIGINPHHVIWR